jgi:DNA-binding NarL/FixJ family response regulator
MHIPLRFMIRLAIIEDNLAYLKALETFIRHTDNIEVVYSGSDLRAFIDGFESVNPDVIIMDIDLPVMSGIEGVRHIKASFPDTNIFMLTVFEDEEKIFESIKAGALGYMLKKDPPDKIVEAIRSIHLGESVMNGQIARKILGYFSKGEAKGSRLEDYNLTRREREILALLIDGLSYKAIAAQCFISMDTVFSHIKNIYSKLNIHSRSELAAKFR